MAASVGKIIKRGFSTGRILQYPPYPPLPPSIYKVHKGNPTLWRNIFFFVALPCIALSALNVYLFDEHPQRVPFIKYEYMYIRKNKFPWGDGDHGLFHNPKLNATQHGYDDERID